VIALNARLRSASNASEHAMIRAGIGALESRRSEALGRSTFKTSTSEVPAGVVAAKSACLAAAKSSRLAAELPGVRSPAEAAAAKSIGHVAVRIRHAPAVPRVMHPRVRASKSAAMIIVESVAMHEIVIDVNLAIEPVRLPAPTESTPAAASTEETADVNARAKPESNAQARIP